MSGSGSFEVFGHTMDEYCFIDGPVENVNFYQKGGYHPVSIGDTFCEGRYEIVHKLGFGGYSTIWLARNEALQKYVAIKFLVADVEDDNEQYISKQLSSTTKGDPMARQLLSVHLDSFNVHGPNGVHKCLVMEPGRMNLLSAKDASSISGASVFQNETHRAVMGQVIKAVAALHDRGIVHGDLHSGNIVFHLPNSINQLTIEELYTKFGKPTREVVARLDGKDVSNSVPKELVFPIWLGVGPKELSVEEASLFLTDFGESYLPKETKRNYSHTLALNVPPEARFSDEPMSFSSDIWTLGCLLFKIISVGPLFRTFFQDPDDITCQHVEVCGKLPEPWWSKWEARSRYWTEDGTFLERVPPETLEDRFEFGCQEAREEGKEELIGDEEKQDFLEALKKMIVLEPDQRATIHDVMETKWYQKWIVPAMAKVKQPQSGESYNSTSGESDNLVVQPVALGDSTQMWTRIPTGVDPEPPRMLNGNQDDQILLRRWIRLWHAMAANFMRALQ